MSSVELLRDQIAPASGASRHWPDSFRPTLAKLATQLAREATGTISLEPIRELRRPFSRVLSVNARAASQSRTLFVKILQPRAETSAELAATRVNVQREYDVTRQVREVVRGTPGLDAVKAVACFPEDFALVTEEVRGQTLAGFLGRRSMAWGRARLADALADTLHLTADWLRTTQRALPAEREVSADTTARYLDRRIDELSEPPRGMLNASGRDQLRRFRDRLLADASRDGLQAVWIHADFCPENIIVGDASVAVLDFTMAGAGTKYHDLAHLFLCIEALRGKQWFTTSLIDRLQATLLEGFEPGLDVSNPLFALARFQHVLCHLVSLQGIEGRLARLRSERQRRQHRDWLAQAAGIAPEGWTR
jgi:aminoglycoside phosphotransferase (APT) family kinase protein